MLIIKVFLVIFASIISTSLSTSAPADTLSTPVSGKPSSPSSKIHVSTNPNNINTISTNINVSPSPSNINVSLSSTISNVSATRKTSLSGPIKTTQKTTQIKPTTQQTSTSVPNQQTSTPTSVQTQQSPTSVQTQQSPTSVQTQQTPTLTSIKPTSVSNQQTSTSAPVESTSTSQPPKQPSTSIKPTPASVQTQQTSTSGSVETKSTSVPTLQTSTLTPSSVEPSSTSVSTPKSSTTTTIKTTPTSDRTQLTSASAHGSAQGPTRSTFTTDKRTTHPVQNEKPQTHKTLKPGTTKAYGVMKPNLENAKFHLKFTLKFNLTYSSKLAVKNSTQYKNYSTTFKNKLYGVYWETKGFQDINIIEFRKGSVICNYAVVYAATVLTTAWIKRTTEKLRDLKVFGQKAEKKYLEKHFSQELDEATRQLSSVCNAVDVCSIGYNCTDENGSVTCHYKCADFTCNNEETCNIDSDGNPYCRCNTVGKFIFGGKKCEQLILTDVVIYIAAGGGGGLLLILTVALICTCVMKGKWKENSSKVSPTKDANLSANGSFVHLPSPTKDHWNTNNHHNGRQRDEYEMIDLARPSDGYDRQQDPVYRDGVPVRHSYADTEVLERRVRDEVRRHDHGRQMSQQYRHTDEVTRGQGHFEERAVDLGYVSRDDRPMSYNDEGLVQDYRAGIPRVQISRSEEQPLAHNVEDHGLRASVGYLGPIDRFPSPEANRLVYPQSQERYVEPPSPLKRFTDAESTQSSGRYSRRLDVSHGRQESNGEIRRHENGRGFGNQDDERPIRRQENDWSVGRQDSSRDTRRQENGMDRRRQETERDLRRNESSREIRRQEYGRDSGRHEINRETKHRGSDRLQEDRRHLEQRRNSEGKMLGNLHRPHSFVAEPESLVFSIGNNSIQIPEADYDANQEHSSESNSANTPLDRRSRDYDYNRPHQIPSQYGVNNSPMARQLRKRAEEIGMRRNLGHDERPSPRVARKPVPDMSRDSRYSQQDRQYSGLRASRR